VCAGFALAAFVLAALLLMAPVAGAACPPRFCGVQAWSTPTDTAYQRISEGRIGIFRQFVFWSRVESSPDSYDWASTDADIAPAARARMPLLITLHSTPAYLRGADDDRVPPRSAAGRARFAAFARRAVERYGPVTARSGSFWKETGLPPVPVSWQLWNEPNGSRYDCAARATRCRPKATPLEYRKLVEAAAPAMRAVQPRARIGLAGLAETTRGMSIATFLRGVYGSRSTARRFARLFDAVSVLPYAKGARDVEAALAYVRGLLRRAGDSSARLWLTEIGWGTDGKRRHFAYATPTEQARKLTGTFRAALAGRRRYGLDMAIWFSLQDREPTAEERAVGHWQPHTGLFTKNGAQKPSWRAFTRITGGRRGSGVGAATSTRRATGARLATEDVAARTDP
jgi:hypothetical protein